MRWLAVSLPFLFVACEQGGPASAPPPPPASNGVAPAAAPAPSPAQTGTASAAAAPSSGTGLQMGKALELNPHPAAREAAPATPTKDGGTEADDPYVAAMLRAIEARKKNDPRAAEVAYRQALKAQPKDANALAGVAEMLFAQDKGEEALKPAELAYELKPTDPEVRWVFGLVLLSKNKRTDDAMAAWEALIKDTPDYAKKLGVADRLKVIKAYSKGPDHSGRTAPKGPSSAPAGGPSSAPAPK